MIGCVDVGGTTLKFGVLDGETPRPLGQVATPGGDFQAFAEALEAGLSSALNPGDPVSLALPGVIDPDTGRVTCANVPCLNGRAAATDLSKALGRPVTAANDADCFTLAEARLGVGAGRRIVFGIILGTGVGGGLVIDGRLVVGTGGLTGEWGHGPVLGDRGFPCGCGQSGCVDTVGGARGLERLDARRTGGKRTSLEIVEAWQAGEPAAAATLEEYFDLVSGPLAVVVNVVGPTVVPVGGGLGSVPALVSGLDGAVRSRILWRTEKPLLTAAGCPGNPGLVGAGFFGLQTFGGGR